jgi:amino acid efflux transporter
MNKSLTRSLTVFRGTGVLLNIVIGAGLLTLPGLAVKLAGDNALYAWALCATASAPLVGAFILLGRQIPDAGGVAAYSQRAFGDFGRQFAAFLLLGAVSLGLPSIALTGGYYLAGIISGPPTGFALILLVLAVIPHVTGAERAARVLAFLASLVLLAVLLFLAIGLLSLTGHDMPAQLPALQWQAAIKPFMLLFFAFTGWEIGAGIGEEFINPKRDFPRAMVLSFGLVTGLYLAIAYVASRVDLSGHYEAPFLVFVAPVFGGYGATIVGSVAALIVLANLSGAIWGVSRLVFSLGRDGILPASLALTRGGQPVHAVIATTVLLSVILMAYGCDILNLETMIELAGQNFLTLYAIAALALFRLSQPVSVKITAIGVLAIAILLLIFQGAKLLYPLAALLVTILSVLVRSRMKRIE